MTIELTTSPTAPSRIVAVGVPKIVCAVAEGCKVVGVIVKLLTKLACGATPPRIVIVFISPVPVAVTPVPTKLSVAAAVANVSPSSSIVNPGSQLRSIGDPVVPSAQLVGRVCDRDSSLLPGP